MADRLSEADFEIVRARCEAKALEYIEAWEHEPATRGRMIADLTKLLIPLTIGAERCQELEDEVARLKEDRGALLGELCDGERKLRLMGVVNSPGIEP